MRRLLSVLLLVAAVAVPKQTRASTWAAQTSVVAHGVRLTLSVPARVYPRDALIAVRVSLRNISPRTIWESPMVVGYCSRVDFLVSILDASGQALDPLPPAPGPYPPCPAPLPYPLRPGQAVSRQVYAVLLSGRLRAMANVNTLSGTRSYSGVDLTTPTVRVRLYPAAAPSISIGTANDSVAVIARPPAARGPLRYEEWSDCGARALLWTAAAGDQVHAGCLNPGEWHLVAGWVGYRAAILDITPKAAALSESSCRTNRIRTISPVYSGVT